MCGWWLRSGLGLRRPYGHALPGVRVEVGAFKNVGRQYDKTIQPGFAREKTGRTRFARWKTVQPPFGCGKCTPSVACRRRLSTGKRLTRFSLACGSLRIVFACHPGGGDLLYAFLSANLSCSIYSAARTSPSGGSPRRGIGVYFQRAAGPVGLFFLRAKGAVVKVLS